MGEYVDKLEVQVVSRAKYLGLKAKEKVADFFTKGKLDDVNVVSIAFLIGIAVVLAISIQGQSKSTCRKPDGNSKQKGYGCNKVII